MSEPEVEKSNDQTIQEYYKSTIKELEKQGLSQEEIVKRLDDMFRMNDLVYFFTISGGEKSWLA